MLPVRLVILGVPKSKKNGRRNYGWQKGRKPVSLPSVEYVAWANSAVMQIYTQWKDRDKITTPVMIMAKVYQGHRQAIDLGNSLEGAWDILEACDVLKNDYLIKAMAPELLRDPLNPRIELLILPYDQERWDLACGVLGAKGETHCTVIEEHNGTTYRYDVGVKPAKY